MTSPPGKTIRVVLNDTGAGSLFWNENSRSWEPTGSYYKSLGHAQAAIVRHKLKNCTPVMNG